MAILTPADQSEYFPTLLLTGSELDAALISTQLMIEGYLGARRPLEPKAYTEQIDITADGRAYLTYCPVIPNSEEFPIVAKIRGGSNSAYGVVRSAAQWQDLPAESLEIDPEIGELIVQDFIALQPMLYGSVPAGYSTARRQRPLERPKVPTVQITYYSGVDFTQDTTDVEQIKRMFAEVLLLVASDAGKGVKRRRVDREYEVEYQTPVLITNTAEVQTSGNIQLDNLLKSFHKYRPRSYAA